MAQTVTFLGHLADTQLRAWLGTAAPSGFYINLHSARAGMVHQVSCWHLGDGGTMNTVTRAKVCASTVAELRTWAEQQQIVLTDCSDCQPVDTLSSHDVG
jgi:hypothetical protein